MLLLKNGLANKIGWLFLCSVVPFIICCGPPPQKGRPPFHAPMVQKTATAKYRIPLIAVERSAVDGILQDKKAVEKVISEDEGSLFEDEMVLVTWKPNPVAFNLRIINKTGSDAKVIWDEARFIGADNIIQRMLHSGYGYDERKLPQPPSSIPSGGLLDDFMHPADNFIFYKNTADEGLSYWLRAPFLPDKLIENLKQEKKAKAPPLKPGELASKLKAQAERFTGKTCSVILPLKINGTRFNYLSTFRIESVEVTEDEIKNTPEMVPPGRDQQREKGRQPGRRFTSDFQ